MSAAVCDYVTGCSFERGDARRRPRRRRVGARATRPRADRARSPQPDDVPALHARARARRRAARRGRPARRRHRALHRPLAEGQVRRRRARLRGPDLVGRASTSRSPRTASRGCARRSSTYLSAQETLYVDRRVRRRRSGAPDRRARRHREPVPRAVREDDVHRPDRRRSSTRSRAAGARAPRARGRGGPGRRTGRAPGRSSSSTRRAPRSLVGGTFYAGEIKKSIFTVMNDRLPLEGVLPDALLGERRRRTATSRSSSGSPARARRRCPPIRRGT